jgi:hypothetical protein
VKGIIFLVIVAPVLAVFAPYKGSSRVAKIGIWTPAVIGGDRLSRPDFRMPVDHSATWDDDEDTQLVDLCTSLERPTPN